MNSYLAMRRGMGAAATTDPGTTAPGMSTTTKVAIASVAVLAATAAYLYSKKHHRG